MASYLIEGTFQSLDYPGCPRGKVPVPVTSPRAQDLLWTYADRHTSVDPEFSTDLRHALIHAGYKAPFAEIARPGPHLIGGAFQSDKYPTCPRNHVPLSVKDKAAQDLLWTYAEREEKRSPDFASALQQALRNAGFMPPASAAL